MIEIKRTSFIHKLNLFLSSKGSWYWNNIDNLCEYFWATVRNILISLIKASLVVGVIGGLIVFMGMALISTFFYSGNPLDHGNWEVFSWWVWVLSPFATLAFAGSIVGAVFLFVISVKALLSSVKWVVNKIRGKKSERTPSILVEYIKARKQKYCPRLKIV